MESNPSLFRRTVIESGVREKSIGGIGKGGLDVMKTLTLEHENEKRELQQLNEKFSVYLNRVRQLEAQNRHLESELDEIKKKWGFDTAKLREQYDTELSNLRSRIDDSERDKCLAEMRIKHAEYEADILKGKIDFIGNLINTDKQKLQYLLQQRDMFLPEMNSLEIRYKDMASEIERLKSDLENNFRKLNDYKNELDGVIFDRLRLQNEIQTLGEQIIFTKALHEEEIKEFQSLTMPQFDFSQFYRMELSRAINDIRKDFETLNAAQQKEIESYYRIRTEELKQQAAEEQRKLEEARVQGRYEVMDMSSLKNSIDSMNKECSQLRSEYNTLINNLRELESDFIEIRAEHERQEAQKDTKLMELNSEIQSVQESLRSAVEGNVSLRFEINTYRRLLEGEERHITSSSSVSSFGRAAQSSFGQISAAPRLDSPRTSSKRVTSKRSMGPITIEECDSGDNFVVVKNSSYSNEQDMSGWSLSQSNDSGESCLYYFPNGYILKGNSQVKIYCNSVSAISQYENNLIADGVYKWLKGAKTETKLTNRSGEEVSWIVEERV